VAELHFVRCGRFRECEGFGLQALFEGPIVGILEGP
jgi:hypothetical protein